MAKRCFLREGGRLGVGGFLIVCSCSGASSMTNFCLSNSQTSLRSNKLAAEEPEMDFSETRDSLCVLTSLVGPCSLSHFLSSERLLDLLPPDWGSLSGRSARFRPTARRLFFCLVAGICFFSSSVNVMLVTSGPMN